LVTVNEGFSFMLASSSLLDRLLSLFAAFFLLSSIAAAQSVETPVSTAKGINLFAGQRVMVLGDSITQDGTYVSFIEYLLNKSYQNLDFDIINIGLSSETTSGLSEPGHAGGKFPRPCVHERLDRALAAIKPTIVMACYGMNDGIYLPESEERMAAFRDGITRLVSRCNAAGAKVILVTPPIYDKVGAQFPYDQVLAKFAEWEITSPPAGVITVVDVHTPMAASLKQRQQADSTFHFAKDGIHPGSLGHLLIALTILQTLDIPVPPRTPDEILPVIEADPLYGLVKQHRETRSDAWLKHVGYHREKIVIPGSGDVLASETEATQLQNKINALRISAK
jgi:lysophospholipase L1-like esterase